MRALITRPRDDAEALVNELNAARVETFIEPLLNIASVPGALAKLDRVQAILLTSRNGVRALAEETDQRDTPIYAVGDATADIARELGFINVESAAGDSAALAQLVEDRLDPGDGALLHGSGTAVAGDLAGTLAAKGFTVRCEILYEARPAIRLSAELQALLTNGALDGATFFSPRTAQTFVNLVNAAGLSPACRAVTAICISPAVVRALGSMEFDEIRVASRPDAPAMIAAVMEVRDQLEAASDSNADNSESETEPETETANETEVPAEDDQIDNDDGIDEAIWEQAVEPPTGKISPAPAAQPAKRSGGRKGVWFLLIAVAVIGAGVATYPKWKSQLPANLISGGKTAPQVALDGSRIAIAELKNQIQQLRAETVGAISKSAKNLKTVEVQIVATEAALAAIEARLAATEMAAKGAAPASLELTVINQRIDSLKQQIENAKSAAAAGNSSPSMPPGVEDRLQRIESAAHKLAAEAQAPASPSAAEQALEAENQRLTTALQSLTGRLEAIGKQVAARDTRLAAIEAATARNAAASNAGVGNGSRGGALVVAVGQLRDALSRSTPFPAPLDTLKGVSSGNTHVMQAIAPLDAFAKGGIPTRALLKRQFSNVAAQATRVALVSRDTGWLDRTLAQLASVVTIRRVGDDVEGDTAQAILARAEARVQADDLAGAVAELARLTGAPAKSVASWRRDAEARLTADKAIGALTRIVIHRLARP
ncbi:MAG: uroporphyrinogen-III synthase [Pseudomonadota bacterium]|nr:uroporphyrinogen-III synthase [Pseudomonadota bacterium]